MLWSGRLSFSNTRVSHLNLQQPIQPGRGSAALALGLSLDPSFRRTQVDYKLLYMRLEVAIIQSPGKELHQLLLPRLAHDRSVEG